jgi:hypothetical protein
MGGPRLLPSALHFSFFSLLGMLHNLGFMPESLRALPETLPILASTAREINENVPLETNPAKSLAQELFGRLPVI